MSLTHPETSAIRTLGDRRADTPAWRPIATAPRDGTRIIGAAFGRYGFLCRVWWQPEFAGWISGARQMLLAEGYTFEGGGTSRLHSPEERRPTHWLPCPAPVAA